MAENATISGPSGPCNTHLYHVTRNPVTRSILRTCRKCGHTELATIRLLDCVKKDNLRVTFNMSNIINAALGE